MIAFASRRRENAIDRATRYALALSAITVAAVLLVLVGVLLQHSQEAFSRVGWGLITGSRWEPTEGAYGGWALIFGTLLTSVLALLLAVPIGFAVALFLTELAPAWLRTPVGVLVELLAGVPSIVYGMWGFFILAPWLRTQLDPFLQSHWGTLGVFQTPRGPPTGLGFLIAGLVLAIMILPTITAIARDALLAVPRLEREAAYALGATRWEVSRSVLRSARIGLFAAATLGLGRALGETMAVTLVIGNVPNANFHILDQGQTIASHLATQMSEATDSLEVSALIALALILFALTLVVNLVARLAIQRPWRRAS